MAALIWQVGRAWGSSGGVSGASPTKTVTVTQHGRASSSSDSAAVSAPAPAKAPADNNRAPAAANDGWAGKPSRATAVPDYQPASIVSKSKYTTVLTSPDSVSKIGSHYQGVLGKGGWQLRSSSNTAYSASFTANRANEGVTISVYPRGSESDISISPHPS